MMQVYRSSLVKKCYAVYVGKVREVYDEWLECQAKLSGFSGGSQRDSDSRCGAEASYLMFRIARERDRYRHLKYYIIALLLIMISLLFYIIV